VVELANAGRLPVPIRNDREPSHVVQKIMMNAAREGARMTVRDDPMKDGVLTRWRNTCKGSGF